MNPFKRQFLWIQAVGSLLVLCVMAAPVVLVLVSGLTPMDEIFIHLAKTEFLTVLANTTGLLLGVAAGTLLLGVSLAWLTTTFEFQGRSLFDWALILPMAVPTYVLAFVSLSIFGRTGPIQGFLRDQGYPILSLGSAWGMICVMTLALYPYVYIFARNGFYTQGVRGMEVARSLGQRHPFYKVALPMARPFIIGGLILALMETLSDFGAASIFNYDTLTTLIYKAWFALFSINAAAKFSFFLVLLAFVLLLVQQKAEGRRRYTTEKHPPPVVRTALKGVSGLLASAYCGLILLFSFIVPVIYLLRVASLHLHQEVNRRYLDFVNHSVSLSILAAFLIAALALILVYAGRSRTFPMTFFVKGATLGYALPGAIFAVGGITLVTFLDQKMRTVFGLTGSFFTGTIFAMMLGYLARFMTLSYNTTETAIRRITPQMDETARSLGISSLRILKRIHLPLIRGGVLTGALLVFVEVMKEMPVTLMTRPFGWDTLAVRIFQFTSEGDWEKAALPALTLVLVGLLPVSLLMRQPRFR